MRQALASLLATISLVCVWGVIWYHDSRIDKLETQMAECDHEAP